MNKEEVIYNSDSGIAISKIYDQTEDDVLNQHLYLFGEDMGTMREIKNYKQQVMEQTEVYCNPPKSGKTYIAKLEKDNLKLQQENTQLKMQIDDLIKYCESEIVSQNKSIELLSNKKYADIHIGKINAYKDILSKLKERDEKS